MKRTVFTIISILLFVSTVYIPFSFAQNYTQMGLPEGAKTRLGKGWISGDIAYSPDGARLAVPSSIGIWIYDANTYTEVELFTGHTSHVNAVAFSPDGKKLISGGHDGTVRVWDANTGQLLHTLDEHNEEIDDVAFSPDGKMFGSISANERVRVWDAHTVERLHSWRFGGVSYFGSVGDTNCLAFSADSKMIACGLYSGRIYFYDAITRERLRRNDKTYANGINTIAFSSDGVTLAMGSGNNGVYLLGARTGIQWQGLGRHSGDVNSVAFSPDGKILASGCDNPYNASSSSIRILKNEIYIWDAITGEWLRSLRGHRNDVLGVAFSPNGKTLASASRTEVRFWNANTGQLLHTLQGHAWSVNVIALSPDGNTLASGHKDGHIRLWDLHSSELLDTLEGKVRQFSTAGANKYIIPISSMAFSPDGKLLASGNKRNELTLWNVHTREPLHTFVPTEEYDDVITVAFSPDSKLLASGDETGEVHVWDIQTLEHLYTFRHRLSRYRGEKSMSIAFSPDGKMIVSGHDDGNIHLWHIESERRLQTIPTGQNIVYSVTYSPDGEILASAGKHDTIKLWSPRSGELLHTLKGHTNTVPSIAFSPDGSMIASGSWKEIRVWDVHTRQHKKTLQGHTNWVFTAFLPDNNSLVSGSPDGTVLLWELPSIPVVSVQAADRPAIYWIDADKGTLHRLVRAEVENLLPSVRNATGLAVDTTQGKLYWTEKTSNRTGKIRTVNLDGTDVHLLKDLTSVPRSVALAGGKIYLTNSWGKVQRLNVDGSNFQPNLITGLQVPKHITMDVASGQIFWTEQTGNSTGRIRRAHLDGSNVRLVKDLTSTPRGIAFDAANRKLYLTNTLGKVQRLNVDGSNFQPKLITGVDAPTGVSVDVAGRKIYWTAQDSIWRSDLNGENIETVVTGLGTPTGIVLGNMPVAAPAAPAMTRIPPDSTVLLANYPNPFNPETWIPYQLAEPADVSISIYTTDGKLVRTLAVGHQQAGVYQSRSRSAYWDGRNHLGEPVSSGVYFYTLTAGDFTATRKMLIRK